MRDDYLSLAAAEEFVGGAVEERRKRLQDAGKAGKLRWTREFALDIGLPAVLFVQPAGWLLEPDWEHGQLAGTPPGFEVRISRKDLVDCFAHGQDAQEAAVQAILCAPEWSGGSATNMRLRSKIGGSPIGTSLRPPCKRNSADPCRATSAGP